MTDNVVTISPERFTLWLNTEGQPVAKPLSEMNAAEVLRAIDWHLEESARLQHETEADSELSELIKMAKTFSEGLIAVGDLDEGQVAALPAAMERLLASGAASAKTARLMQLVRAVIMPQWHLSPRLSLTAALRRFWPR